MEATAHAGDPWEAEHEPIHTEVRTATPATTRYAYKASLIGAAHEFELTDAGLAWRIGGRASVWPYADIAAVRLSYRPVSMQARRFRADIIHADGRRLGLLSASWQTAALMRPQSEAYRIFITELHARLAAAGSRAVLTGGLGAKTYLAALLLVALLAVAMVGLWVRAVWTGELWGALYLLGFAALFAWQVGGFIVRNRPLHYAFGHLPPALLP
jgi:hypothetical protein